MTAQLRQEACAANIHLFRAGLVTLTFGNASAIDRKRGRVAIKPSGVAYEALSPETMVIVDLDGNVLDGELNPSSDTPTHLRLYRAFESIGGIAHTHSTHATIFAQAHMPIPCLGTTHADHFHGEVPVTRQLTGAEVEEDYEGNTGNVIIERLADLDSASMPAVLVAGHAPFTWGRSASEAVVNSIALEAAAEMAIGTMQLNDQAALPDHIINKHYRRKHGPDAYYGQK